MVNKYFILLKGNYMVKMNAWLEFKLKWDPRAGPVLFIKFRKRKFGLAFCHRREDRSLNFFRYTMPLCARCTGIIVGFMSFLLLFLLNFVIPQILALVLILPLLIDGFSQLFSFRKSNDVIRLITGALFTPGLLSLMAVLL